MRCATIREFTVGEKQPLLVMCGPCAIESEEHLLHCAKELKRIFTKFNMPLIFKSSYDKANRSSIHSPRGVGLDEGLRLLEKVKREFDLPVVTDVHSPAEALAAGEVCDLLQIPAFLCRQTDLIMAAASTSAAVSIKKGQFMAPWDMKHVVEKVQGCGNPNVILIERGASFGYNNLVSDMRAIPIMQGFGVPVCFDATHSVQLPGGKGASSGGQREFVGLLAKSALAAGADCLFMEAHPDPQNAFSDKDTQLNFNELECLLPKLKKLYELINE